MLFGPMLGQTTSCWTCSHRWWLMLLWSAICHRYPSFFVAESLKTHRFGFGFNDIEKEAWFTINDGDLKCSGGGSGFLSVIQGVLGMKSLWVLNRLKNRLVLNCHMPTVLMDVWRILSADVWQSLWVSAPKQQSSQQFSSWEDWG